MNVPKLRFKEFDGEWEEQKLGDITEKIGSGKTPKGGKATYQTEGITLIRSQNIFNDQVNSNDIAYISTETDESMKNSRVFNGDILLNITGASIGRSAVYKKDVIANVNQHVCIIRPKKDYSSDFIQLNISSNKGQKEIEFNQAGGGREGLNFQQIAKMKFNYPSIKEQNKISLLFEKLNKKIQLQQQKIDLLQEQKKGYMQKIFDNNKSDTSGEKWERINLNEIFLIIDGDRGKNYPSEEEFLEHGHTLFLDTKNVTKKGFKFNTKKFISEEKCKKMNNGLLMRNDLVLTSRGTIGNLALYDDSVPFNSVRINSAMLILRLVKPDISLMFLYHLLKSKVLIDFIRSSSVGSAQPHITKKDLKSLKVTFPSSLVSQEKIARFLSLIDESVKFEEEKLGLLLKQKQGFMQQMFI